MHAAVDVRPDEVCVLVCRLPPLSSPSPPSPPVPRVCKPSRLKLRLRPRLSPGDYYVILQDSSGRRKDQLSLPSEDFAQDSILFLNQLVRPSHSSRVAFRSYFLRATTTALARARAKLNNYGENTGGAHWRPDRVNPNPLAFASRLSLFPGSPTIVSRVHVDYFLDLIALPSLYLILEEKKKKRQNIVNVLYLRGKLKL